MRELYLGNEFWKSTYAVGLMAFGSGPSNDVAIGPLGMRSEVGNVSSFGTVTLAEFGLVVVN